jgi:hypothetical protein
MEFSRYTRYFCLLTLGLTTVFIYLLLTNHYIFVIRSFDVPFIRDYILPARIPDNTSLTNETESNYTFESRLFNFYPRLPIHIFTQNLSLIGNRSKLILIGNGFFGDRDWGIAKSDRTSQQISTNIYFLIIQIEKFLLSFQ